jgi:glycosyltransferase involved in cell wall biosynthesis
VSAWPVTISLPPGLTIGGVTTWALELADSLSAAGREVRIVAHAGYPGHRALAGQEVAAGPGVEVIQAPPLSDPSEWHECVRLYCQQLPMLMLPNLTAESYAVAAALASVHPDKVRVAAWNHGDDAYAYACLSYYQDAIHRFVAVSSRCQEQLRQRLPARREDIVHLPHGVRPGPAPQRPPSAGRPVRLAYGGRIEQVQKRIFDVISLAEELERRGVCFEMRLVGDGPQVGELNERIAALRSRRRDPGCVIRLEPPVPHAQMREVWQWADVFVQTSGYEGLSLSMIEAMACGCVPVVSRVESGVGDVVIEGRNGLTFPVGDITAAADCVERLVREPVHRAELSRAARATIERHFSFDRYLAGVRVLLEELEGAPPRPWPPARPLWMSEADGSRSATVPSDAADRARRVLKRIAAERAGPVALYGAGRHTRALAGVWAESPVPIVAVLDDDHARGSGRLWGWPVLDPQRACESGAGAVLISSWLHEQEIWRRQAAQLKACGLRVYRLYGGASPL